MARGEKSCELPSLPLHHHPDIGSPGMQKAWQTQTLAGCWFMKIYIPKQMAWWWIQEVLKKDLGLKTRTARPSWESLHVQWRTKGSVLHFSLCSPWVCSIFPRHFGYFKTKVTHSGQQCLTTQAVAERVLVFLLSFGSHLSVVWKKLTDSL